jgi:hypothetical protein
VRKSAFAFSGCIVSLATSLAFAQDQPESPTLSPDAHIDFSAQPPEPRSQQTEVRGRGPEPTIWDGRGPEPANLGEEPPLAPRPRHKGLVLESTLGILGFAGQFRHVAPPAYWMHAQLGYELLSWFMLFGEAELAFTDTSEAQGASRSRAFPIWGVGTGARAGVHFSERIAGFVQADIGALTAYVPHDALAYLGFRSAESMGAQFGARVGVEWYQKDRHFALCAQGGPRLPQGFSKFAGQKGQESVPLMWDAAIGLRYTF